MGENRDRLNEHQASLPDLARSILSIPSFPSMSLSWKTDPGP